MHIKINHNNQEENSGSTQSTAWGKITILHWRPRRLHRLQDSQVQHLVDTPSSEGTLRAQHSEHRRWGEERHNPKELWISELLYH